jgi:hypothetical protein
MIMLMGVSFASVPSLGDGDQSPLMPPQSQAFGKSLEEWNVLWTQRSLEENLGGGTDIPNTVGRVRLLPGDVGNPSPVFDVTLPPGTPFVATPFFVYGERYDDPNVPDDDPIALASVLQQIFADIQVQIVLDGRVLLEGTGAALQGFQFGPVYFDQPIIYAEPQPRGGGLNSIAALWVMGIGAVYHPLPVGQHTLVYTVHSSFFGDFLYTYNITVSPR